MANVTNSGRDSQISALNNKLPHHCTGGQATFFSARMGRDTVIPYEGVLVFDVVLTNTGNGYDVSTGHFVVPSQGVYSFDVTIISDFYERVFAVLVAAGQERMYLHAGNAAGFNIRDSSTNTVILSLDNGDHVYVRIKRAHYGKRRRNFNYISRLFSTFSGAKLCS